jgi:hypothetical protein
VFCKRIDRVIACFSLVSGRPTDGPEFGYPNSPAEAYRPEKLKIDRSV